jgi:hypothetical protein
VPLDLWIFYFNFKVSFLFKVIGPQRGTFSLLPILVGSETCKNCEMIANPNRARLELT